MELLHFGMVICSREQDHLSLHLGTTKSFFRHDLGAVTGALGRRGSDKNSSASPLKTLKTSKTILKSILKWMGSDAKTRVICFCFIVPVKNQAASFDANRWQIVKPHGYENTISKSFLHKYGFTLVNSFIWEKLFLRTEIMCLLSLSKCIITPPFLTRKWP